MDGKKFNHGILASFDSLEDRVRRAARLQVEQQFQSQEEARRNHPNPSSWYLNWRRNG